MLTAAKDNDGRCVAQLLSAGADPNAENAIGQTALHVACLWGSADVVELLLKGGADANVQNQFGVTPLHYAGQSLPDSKAKGKMPEEVLALKKAVAQSLLAHGARTDLAAGNGRLPYESVEDESMRALFGAPSLKLHEALASRELAEVVALVSAGHDLTERDSSRKTALHHAVQDAIAEAVSEAAAADSESEDEGAGAAGGTLGNGLCAAILRAVLSAAEGPSAESLGGALGAYDDEGRLPLHVSVGEGAVGVSSALIEAGAPVSAHTLMQGHMFRGNWTRRSADGSTEILGCEDQTSLHLALDTDEPDLKMVRMLLRGGADPNARDAQMRTPVHLAIEEGEVGALKLLLDAGGDMRLGNKDVGMENTALHQATMKAAVMIIDLLCKRGAEVDAVGRDGWTPLCLAARSGSVPACKVLLAAGAKPDAPMENGKTALDIAEINKKPAVLKLLRGE